MIELRARPLPPECEALRAEVRAFLARELAAGGFTPQCDSWLKGFSREFSRKLGARGWLGMTWPVQYGGRARPPLERFVVIEELLAAGAPVAAHWFGDRQMGASILRHGTEEQKQSLLPGIARGELVFAGGYSEPDVGSDLSSVRTRAERTDGGWRIHGTKVWTSHAHEADYMFVLCRTEAAGEDKHAGLSILIAKLPAEGMTIRPVPLLTGGHHFNEVVFDGVFVPDAMVLGQPGDGWRIITSELVLERSGPERFMSTFPLLVEMVRALGRQPANERARVAVGELLARFQSLRSMSIAIAAALEDGLSPGVEAALVKDMGTRFEGDVAECARTVFESFPSLDSEDTFDNFVAQSVLHTPGFTLRGGANEVLRGIIARGLGSAVMGDTLEMLRDSLARVLRGTTARDTLAAEAAGLDTSAWQDLCELGVAGPGADDMDLALHAVVLRETAYAGALVPYADSEAIGRWLARGARLSDESGRLAVCVLGANAASVHGGRVLLEPGKRRIGGARLADTILFSFALDGAPQVAAVRGADIELRRGANVASEPHDGVIGPVEVASDRVREVPAGFAPEAVRARGALCRAIQMEGAMARANELTLQYARDRKQFSRPLAQYQVIQSYLAAMAGELCATQAAVQRALAADGDVEASAVAKVRAGQAARVVTGHAHQVHGAIGFTREYPLQVWTRRLWAWREEFGNESSWAAMLGAAAAARGADALWAHLSAPTAREPWNEHNA